MSIAFFGLLSLLHLPIVNIAGDAIGVFDIFVVGIFFFAMYRLVFKESELPVIGVRLTAALLCFLAFITLCASNLLIRYLLGEEIQLFQFALLIKQIQYLLIIFAFYFVSKRDKEGDALYNLAFINILVVAAVGIYKVEIAEEWVRLGLPFKEGISSNPAGFVLATSILMLTFSLIGDRVTPSRRLFNLLGISIGLIALAYTKSRTNIIGLALTCIFYFALSNINSPKKLMMLVSLTIVIAIFGGIIYNNLGQSYGRYPLLYIINPDLLFKDGSFLLRVNTVWYGGLEEFRKEFLNMLFGIGLGSVRYSDGLYPALLFTTGLLGLILYLMALFFFLLRLPLEILVMLLFILINGVAVETTINSFRVMQVFLPMLILGIKKFEELGVLRRNRLSDNGPRT